MLSNISSVSLKSSESSESSFSDITLTLSTRVSVSYGMTIFVSSVYEGKGMQILGLNEGFLYYFV